MKFCLLPLACLSLISVAPSAFARLDVPTFHANGSAPPTPIHRSAPIHVLHSRVHHASAVQHTHTCVHAVHFCAHSTPAPRHMYGFTHIRPVYSRAHLAGGSSVAQGGNLVEPLSNHLPLSSTKEQVVRRLGAVRDDGNYLLYPKFNVQYSHNRDGIRSVTITNAVRLHCGLGLGSPASAVVGTLGSGRGGAGGSDQINYGQYHLTFGYGPDSRVDSMDIAPKDTECGFVPY